MSDLENLSSDINTGAQEVEKKEVLPKVETESGVIYKYLPGNRVVKSRQVKKGFWPKEEGEKITGPLTTLVFLPDYNSIRKVELADFDTRLLFGEDEKEYMYRLGKLMKRSDFDGSIVNKEGKKLSTNSEIKAEEGYAYLSLSPNIKLPVAKNPRKNFYPFETKESKEEREWNLESSKVKSITLN